MTTHAESLPGGLPGATTHAMPRAEDREEKKEGTGGLAPLLAQNAELVQKVMLIVGAVLLPAGLVIIGLGWEGVRKTPYTYDQMAYLMSGGILGLGLCVVGGFLYFGAWMARQAQDNKAAQQNLADTLAKLIAVVEANGGSFSEAPAAPAPVAAAASTPATPAAGNGGARAAAPAAPRRGEAVGYVVAGSNSTLHRADCSLIADRDDLNPVALDAPGLTPCRICMR